MVLRGRISILSRGVRSQPKGPATPGQCGHVGASLAGGGGRRQPAQPHENELLLYH